MPLPGPTHIPPIGEQTDPDKVRVAAVIGGQLASAPARGFGLTPQELGNLQALTAGYSVTAETRSRIINGAMQISQENGSATGTTSSYYPADQWVIYKVHSAGTVTSSRFTLGYFTPNRNIYAIRTVITAADASLAAGEVLAILQPIEGSRMTDLAWGYPEAKQVIVRFGFTGPAGTYAMAITNSNESRAYVASFTITAPQANTPTTQTFVVPGDTTGTATWPVAAVVWGYFYVTLAAGSTFAGTNATWQTGPKYGVTGMTNGMGTAGSIFELYDVGLYFDPDATGLPPKWTMPDEARELAACQRYWVNFPNYIVNTVGTGYTSIFAAPMRVAPALTGGGAGFVTTFSGTTAFHIQQTARVSQSITANARM